MLLFRPPGLVIFFGLAPTAYAVGCILTPLRGYGPTPFAAGFLSELAYKGRPQALKREDTGTLIGTAEAVPFPVADVSRFIAGTSAALQANARVVHEGRRLRRGV